MGPAASLSALRDRDRFAVLPPRASHDIMMEGMELAFAAEAMPDLGSRIQFE